MDKTRALVREQGFVTTLFGRKVNIPDIRVASRSAHRQFAERAAINAPIQGAAADVIRRAMIRMPRRCKAAGLTARMLLQVHDELVFEAPAAEAEATCALARRVMERAAEPAVALSRAAGGRGPRRGQLGRGALMIRAAVALGVALVVAGSADARAERIPRRVGQCAITRVKAVETRLEDGLTHRPIAGSGSAIRFTNGGYQVSYETVPAVEASRPGDPVGCACAPYRTAVRRGTIAAGTTA